MSNLLKPRELFVAEISVHCHAALDSMNEAVSFFFTLGAVAAVNPLLAQPHRDALNRPFFAARVEHHGHRNTTAERRQQQRVRIRAGIFTAGVDWFVGREHVPVAVADFVPQIAQRCDCYVAHAFAFSLSYSARTQICVAGNGASFAGPLIQTTMV